LSLRDPRTKSAITGQARNPDPSLSRSPGDPSDAGIDAFSQIVREQLIPQISNRTRNSISVDGRHVLLYQRLRSGRRCTCWQGVDSTPTSECPICLATGFSGGFLKWGTDLYLMDPSREWRGINVLLNPLIGVPPWFTLEAGAVSGYVEWYEDLLKTSYFGLDVSRFEYRRNRGSIELQLKLEGSDPSYVPFTENALKQRVLLANGGRIFFRVYMKRAVASDPSPMFLYFMFRTLVRSTEQPILLVDIPRRNESVVLQEFGILESLNQVNMVFSDVVKRINVEDAVIRLFDMTRWKVIESSPNDPKNLLTSHDVNVRKVYEDEGINRIIL
jgi:hypothetical protein